MTKRNGPPEPVDESAAEHEDWRERLDEDWQDDPAAVDDEIARILRTKAPLVAVNTLMEVCLTKTSPGPAKATAAVALARICNMLDKGAPRDGKQPHEMTGQELEAELTRLRQEAVGRTVKPSRSRAGAARAQNDGTVFE